MSSCPTIAYFSMEIAADDAVPSYSGGLGVLAGDTLRAAADLSLPMVAVTLVYHHGYFTQLIDQDGRQAEKPVSWNIHEKLADTQKQIELEIEGRKVHAKIWRYEMKGVSGSILPIFFLDTHIDQNDSHDQALCGALYAGDQLFRLRQEALLGMGGYLALKALGYEKILHFHMNEGHAALLTLSVLAEERNQHTEDSHKTLLNRVRERCVFTTHTPVAAGHDHFSPELASKVLGEAGWKELSEVTGLSSLHMTHLALHFSGFANAVSLRHSHVSRELFPGHAIHSITNGVHAATWSAPSFQGIFDRYVPEWRQDAAALRDAGSIPREEIGAAHAEAKRALLGQIKDRSGQSWDPAVLTIGFARRSTPYKRMLLLFSDIGRLNAIAERWGALQLVFGGKAHPHDHPGKDLIYNLLQRSRELCPSIKLVFLPNYETALAKFIISGVDVWLNTPRPPWEASGTSGMKAALNGIPSLSTLDGWWIEGCVHGVTGWGIGKIDDDAMRSQFDLDSSHAHDLYRLLEHEVFPMYYQDTKKFLAMRQSAIAINGSYFNTHRMMHQYRLSAYRC